jgi:hypothetical protein
MQYSTVLRTLFWTTGLWTDPVQYCTEDSVLDRPQVAKVLNRPQKPMARVLD